MSERDRFSLLGHADMPLMNAMREDELLALLAQAELQRGDAVLDLGGGRADLGRLCVQRYGCLATSVDRSPAACELARERTAGLDVDVLCQDARAHLETAPRRDLALAAALGALHAFGTGVASWTRALEALEARARFVLLGDLVALGPRAAAEMDVATLEEIAPLLSRARDRVVLGADRVIAYEEAWCEAVDAYLDAHPGDPRSAWATQRIAWSRDAARHAAWRELAFVALLIPGGALSA